MPLISANGVFRYKIGDTLRIISVDDTVVTVEQRRTGHQRILALAAAAARSDAGYWTSPGAFGPDEANWPGAK